MIDSKLTKQQLIARLIKSELDNQLHIDELYELRRAGSQASGLIDGIQREKEELHDSLSSIRQAIETAHAVCYPLFSLDDISDLDTPKDFNLLKHIYRLANRF